VPVIPKEDKLEDPAPELMRLRIISVAALNCGTYLGVESAIRASLEVVAAGALELEAGASIVGETKVCAGGPRGFESVQFS
jgi:hypothetical protein